MQAPNGITNGSYNYRFGNDENSPAKRGCSEVRVTEEIQSLAEQSDPTDPVLMAVREQNTASAILAGLYTALSRAEEFCTLTETLHPRLANEREIVENRQYITQLKNKYIEFQSLLSNDPENGIEQVESCRERFKMAILHFANLETSLAILVSSYEQ